MKILKSVLLGVFVLMFSQFAQAAGGYQTACEAHCADGATCSIVATDFSFPWTSSCNYDGAYVECFTRLADGSIYPGSYSRYSCN